MILSMTGFGRGIAASANRKFTVEVKSLNSKQLDFSIRVPLFMKEVEVETRNAVAAALERGKVEVCVTVENIGEEASATLNTPLIKIYKQRIEQLAADLGIAEPTDWYSVLLRMPDVMRTEAAALSDDDLQAFREACRQALDALTDFRTTEGARLFSFFTDKINNIGRLLGEVDPFETERVAKIRTKLEEQLSHLTMVDYDKGRLEQELIFYIEKLDVTEEKLRLRTHLRYFLETLGEADGPRPSQGQGKKLGFIAQEIGREINTLGSKSNDAGMQRLVVGMKDELEQIKEQVLNVL